MLKGGTDRKPVTIRVITRVMGTIRRQRGLAQPGTAASERKREMECGLGQESCW